jgi:hypothetical protein
MSVRSLVFGQQESTDSNSDCESGDDAEIKTIGSGVAVNKYKYECIDFNHPLKAAPVLCLLYFGQETLASHTVSAKGNNSQSAKPQLPESILSTLLNHVMKKYFALHGENAKVRINEHERVPLTFRLLRKSVMKKCYYCSKAIKKAT